MRPMLFVLVLLALTPPARAGEKDRRLDIHWIDVEGGGATLIVTPAGESVLIDTGNPGGRDAQRIHDAARAVGLSRLDHVVITHHHVDHYGGAAELADLMPIGALYENGIDSAPESERSDKRLAAYLEAKVRTRIRIEPGHGITLRSARGAVPVRLRFLGSRTVFAREWGARQNKSICAGHEPVKPDESDNKNSAVLLLEHGPFRFFDGGDLTRNSEADLVCPRDRVGPVDVYQTNNHGLDSSNNPVLIKTLQPVVAVMNNGPRKGAQPRTMATLQGLTGLRALYQVHRNLREGEGETNTGDAYIANAGDPCGAGRIHLSVAPNGRRYTVHVPATGHQATYQTRRR